MNILIKLMSIVSLVIAPYIAVSGKIAANPAEANTVYMCMIDGMEYSCSSRMQCDSLLEASDAAAVQKEDADW